MDNQTSCPICSCRHDRPAPPPACDLRCGRRGRASRRRAVGASAPGAERPGDLPRRRQGRGGDGGCGRTALSRRAWARPVAADRHRHHPPRPWRADAADQGHRGRPSRARRSRAESRRRYAASRGRGDRGRSAAGAVVRRRFGELDRAGRGRFVRAEAAGEPRAAAFGRADRRDEHRPQASVADQGRPAGPRGPTRRNRHAGDLRRSARRSVGDCIGTDGAGSHHAGGRPRAGGEVRSRGRRCRQARARGSQERELQARRSRLRARAIRDDCETEGFARCRDQGRKGCRIRGDRPRRRSRRRGARRCRRSCAAGAEGAERRQAHRRSCPAANSP